jgi:hypothetical protein
MWQFTPFQMPRQHLRQGKATPYHWKMHGKEEIKGKRKKE